MHPTDLNQFIHTTAKHLGFSKVGIANAIPDKNKETQLTWWLDKQYHASMGWMKNRSQERGNILKYYPKAKSVISVGLNYFTGNPSKESNIGKISNYAWGDDYHNVLKPRLNELYNRIKKIKPNIEGIVCTDTSPIMEKDWAQKAGIGWIGKHTNLITKNYGSWIFLGELILNIEIKNDDEFSEDLCGTCTACLDACPTNAFPEPYVLDSSKCISYLTIEHRNDFSKNQGGNLSGWIYGCDICQEVCPWNIKFYQESNEECFKPRKNLQHRSIDEWKNLTEEEFKLLFNNSAIKRTKYKGLKRNINHNLQ